MKSEPKKRGPKPGGTNPNAGRKPIRRDSARLSARVLPGTIEAFAAAAAASECSVSIYLDLLASRGLPAIDQGAGGNCSSA